MHKIKYNKCYRSRHFSGRSRGARPSPSKYIDLAKPKSGARTFFSHMSQGHNALLWPGLEPGLSDLEPSALTIGLLNKARGMPAVQLTAHVKSSTLYSRTVIWLYIQIFFWLDGLLLFCIIMGLCFASSTIRPVFYLLSKLKGRTTYHYST